MGSSLVETLVALALLVVVITPLMGVPAALAGRRLAERQSEAIRVARTHLETALWSADDAEMGEVILVEGVWTVRRKTWREGLCVGFEVEVQRVHDPFVAAVLATKRFMP